MKNNKGYYSWIHTLNNSAISAHKKGIEMLAESNGNDPKSAGGDDSAYERLKAMKDAEKMADLAKIKGPIDFKPEGSAQDVEYDAENGFIDDPPLSRLPSYPIAAKAREETADLERAKDWEESEDARHWSGYTGRTGEKMYESVSQKINRFLKN
jgi:hypothetical protein